MLLERPSDDTLYAALLARDAAYDGLAYVAVRTTGIFCRLTCPARKPKRAHVIFFETTAECLEAGFRPCLRCRPLSTGREPEPAVSALIDLLEQEPERRWGERDLIERGYDPSTVRRQFKRRFGVSFLELARLRRLGQAAETLTAGTSVIDAQLDAGYESGSGFRAAITRLFGAAPKHLQTRDLLKADWIDTPIGPMLAIADRLALHLLEFADRPALPAEIRKIQENTRSAIAIGRCAPIDQIATELDSYFAGQTARFDTRLAAHGTPFQRSVWERLRAMAPGETLSYGALARDLGRPAAIRAIAQANGANQIAIVIPCHRIIGADGSLTGYGGGLWRKRWLLRHENRMNSRASEGGTSHEPDRESPELRQPA
ncbi:bifunctional transcriptional activator/DNA repair enzyme AdaA [Oceanibaculum nanhaiense]|uniref:bifunctional transcriptional activator/DNA repair enzyme AdaA n=1 Tax=Oceanibaculum nanhaiense TaxID=1909734 RepID=UPI000A3D0587|nr:trifunctional transcriptional activator/DNA repair protein Ada/methylated-DNA--[protein]-cysteine S-methyltransferase [Oceanibaculum nanhaiense]